MLTYILSCAHVDDAVGIVFGIVKVRQQWLQTSF